MSNIPMDRPILPAPQTVDGITEVQTYRMCLAFVHSLKGSGWFTPTQVRQHMMNLWGVDVDVALWLPILEYMTEYAGLLKYFDPDTGAPRYQVAPR